MAQPIISLPFEITTEAGRLEVNKRRKALADTLTREQRKRFDEIQQDQWNDALAMIELMMQRAQDLLDKSSAGKDFKDRPVAFTQGRSLALTGVLAKLWTDIRAAEVFHREQREALEKRIAELEARPAFEDAGVWTEDKSYQRGNGVTENGSFWLAKRNTMFGEKPGASDAWRLAVKRGRDGKDVRT